MSNKVVHLSLKRVSYGDSIGSHRTACGLIIKHKMYDNEVVTFVYSLKTKKFWFYLNSMSHLIPVYTAYNNFTLKNVNCPMCIESKGAILFALKNLSARE